ncbi:MAG: hypothetical protein P8Y58_12575 [Novosphingobium sp.]
MTFRPRLFEKTVPGPAIAAAGMLMPMAGMAQVSDLWRVSGEIDGKAFVLDCRFVPSTGNTVS